MLDEIAQLDTAAIRTLFDNGGEFRRERSGGEYHGDFHADLARARDTGPVHPGTVEEVLGQPVHVRFPEPVFSAFSYETVNKVFRDRRTFSSETMRGTFETFGPNILAMDGAEHARRRGAAMAVFARNMMGWWTDRWIAATADALLARFETRGRADLNLELCALLPLLTITGSFGVPVEQALELRHHIENMISGTIPRSERLAASAAAGEIIRPVIADRRRHPRDDVITRLVQEGSLTDEDVLAYARLLLTAGSGTTWRQLGITLWALLENPGQLAAVARDRTLVRAAVEESLRWEVTDPTFYRRAVRDTTLGGVAVPAGARVALCLTAANHDPARWPEPDRYDLFRPLLPHLAFASGAHVCLGMHVARTEMSVALNAILDRLPNLRWDPGAARPGLVGLHARGPAELPVVFSTADPE